MKNKKEHGSLLKESILSLVITAVSCTPPQDKPGKAQTREKISINNNWSFFKYSSAQEADSLIYDVRPEVKDKNDNKEADSKPTEAVEVKENFTSYGNIGAVVTVKRRFDPDSITCSAEQFSNDALAQLLFVVMGLVESFAKISRPPPLSCELGIRGVIHFAGEHLFFLSCHAILYDFLSGPN